MVEVCALGALREINCAVHSPLYSMLDRPWRIMLKNCPIMLCSNAF